MAKYAVLDVANLEANTVVDLLNMLDNDGRPFKLTITLMKKEQRMVLECEKDIALIARLTFPELVLEVLKDNEIVKAKLVKRTTLIWRKLWVLDLIERFNHTVSHYITLFHTFVGRGRK